MPKALLEIMQATVSLEAFAKYSPDQPRVPAGRPEGGQWTRDGGGEVQVVQRIAPTIFLEEPPVTIRPPLEQFPQDMTKPPAPGYQWEGKGPPGSSKGNWYNEGTDEYLHPDMEHLPLEKPHMDYRAPDGSEWRWYPDGTMIPKMPGVLIRA